MRFRRASAAAYFWAFRANVAMARRGVTRAQGERFAWLSLVRDLGWLGCVRRLITQPDSLRMQFFQRLQSATKFFRDADVQARVQDFLRVRVHESADSQRGLRIWVCGCSTGEEAYSYAMLAREAMHGSPHSPTIEMIVTDVNPDAIAVAKAGTYRLPPPASISRARFARFFDVNEGEYRVNEALRSLCRFSVQDVRGDAPATDLDLISCRNLLTFCLNGGEQQAAFEAFHRSLKPGGWLVIGKADTLAVPASLFSVVHREQRIFVRNPVE